MMTTYSDQEHRPVRAAVHVYIPLFTFRPMQFRRRLLRSEGWRSVTPETQFYTRYVERIFQAHSSKSANALTVNCLVMQNDSVCEELLVRGRRVLLSGVRLYCFDTSIAFLDFRVAMENTDMNTVADVCSHLRLTSDKTLQRQILRQDAEAQGTETYEKISLNTIAKGILSRLGKYRLFDHLGQTKTTRAELFATVIADGAEIGDPNLHLYRIAAGLDARYQGEVPEDTIFSHHSHIRWAVTSKGACSMGILTDDPTNRGFVCDKWMGISESRHVLWYMLTMHQKYAMFHYLNEIAERSNLTDLRSYQRRIVLFNAKYRFEVISEDPTYQTPYQMARDAKSVENVFEDIDEKIERINDYHNVTADKNNVVAMTIVSLVCAISTFIDIFEWGGVSIGAALGSMSFDRLVLLGVIVLAMSVAIALLVIKPLLQWLFHRLKNCFYHVLERFFYH